MEAQGRIVCRALIRRPDATGRPPVGDNASGGPLPLTDGAAIVATLEDDAARSWNACDNADVMWPHSDGAGRRSVGARSVRGPFACEIVAAVGYAEMVPEPPATPCAGARI